MDQSSRHLDQAAGACSRGRSASPFQHRYSVLWYRCYVPVCLILSSSTVLSCLLHHKGDVFSREDEDEDSLIVRRF